ncbi:Ig-like domain-containing protein [Micromonospora sp. WMMD1102]|uniref:Ig-like domain-containing protein n=1 Tax=Micromonospora sp. WMMD1102 TaxID=3016105 RepID=UPI0024154603|nr:Ig-like domain-containing protein [Micromonospora sp. WMMD1102]MDG4786491.1 Ig-like domain-containing protein [Micromonospora sp. WMMD1102]
MTVLATVATGLVVTARPAEAALVRPFTPRFQASERGDVIFAGNALVTCLAPAVAGTPTCPSAQAGAVVNNNNYTSQYVDADNVASTANSSSAVLSVPTGATVLWAGLYWMGSATATNNSRQNISLARPGSGYTALQGQVTTGAVSTTGGVPYSGFAEVTALVRTSGTYTVAGLTTSLGTNARGGWAIVAAIRDSTQPLRNLAIFDGYAELAATTADNRVTTAISGFRTPTTGAVNARIGAVASEGDLATTGDGISFNGVALSDSLNPATNFFNSSVTRLGARVTGKNPDYVNQLGFDTDYVTAPSGSIGNGQTSATVAFTTSGESYEAVALFTVIDIYEPDITATNTVARVGGGSTVNPGDVIEYTTTVNSTGSENATGVQAVSPLPTGTTYISGSMSINGTARTDAAGDDNARLDTANNRLVLNLGTGATATSGGTMAPGSQQVLRFRVRVNDPAPAGLIITNQATITYGSPTSSTTYTDITDDPGSPGATDPTRVDVNDAPTASPGTLTTGEDTPLELHLTTYASDPDQHTLTFTVSQPSPGQGSLTCTTGGTCTYTPPPNYHGQASFDYTATDPGNRSASSRITITVTPVNDPPVAAPDTATTTSGTPVVIDVIANDADIDGDTLTVVPTRGTTAHGEYSCTPAACTYTPAPTFVGQDTFTYRATDPGNGTSTGTVTVTVSAGPTGLNIGAPESVVLPAVAAGTPALNGPIGLVSVIDDRGTASGTWTATVAITDFVHGNGTAGHRVHKGSIVYTSGPPVETTGAGTFLPQPGAALTTPQFAARWSGGTGPNRVAWEPTLTLALPVDLVTGEYLAAITHSVA